MNSLPYPVVTVKNPILIVYVKGTDLSTIVSIGETALYVKRIGDLTEYAKYFPFEEKKNQLSFAFDNVLFDRLGGRYLGRLVYKGVEIQTIEFIYKPEVVSLMGVIDV